MAETESREDWKTLLDNAEIGVHLVAADGTILWANTSELGLLGYAQDEYFGRSICDFHADSDVIQCILTMLTDGESLSAFPARLRAKDGSVKHVMINSNVYREGGRFVHTRCFTSPISKTVYEALRKEGAHQAA